MREMLCRGLALIASNVLARGGVGQDVLADLPMLPESPHL